MKCLRVTILPHSRQIKHIALLQGDTHRLHESRIGRGILPGYVRVPGRERDGVGFSIASFPGGTVHDKFKIFTVLVSRRVCARPERSLVDTGVAVGREQDEVLLASDLHVNVLVVVLVKGGDGVRVSYPFGVNVPLASRRRQCWPWCAHGRLVGPGLGRVVGRSGFSVGRYSPHIDGVGLFLQSNSRERYVPLHLVEEGDVLVPQVVIFCRCMCQAIGDAAL